MSSTTEEVIVRLLRNLGSKKEVEQYLRLFSSVDSKRFAVIKVSGRVVQDDLESLASSLTFLDRVGLTPVIIHGAGPQLLRALEEAGIEWKNDDGKRVSSAKGLEVARRVFQRENLRLVEALEALGTRARPITTGVFQAEILDEGRLGFVGRVTGVASEAIESSIRSDHIPVIASLGESASGQILNINADVAARELVLYLQPFKVVFLTGEGGLRDEDGKIISAINLEEDYEHLLAAEWLDDSARSKLVEIKAMLDALPRSSSVSVAAPDHLAKELFTFKGAGTLVRKGERIRRYETLEGIDRERLVLLLEESFGRKLHGDYFAKKQFFRIYLADSYRATAILTLVNGVPYLDKFAVTTEAQGDGIGGSMWQRIARDNEKLFWRARVDNEVNPWYFQRADGSYKTDTWTVFWYGLQGFDEIAGCVDQALAMPATLKQHHLGGGG